jgi:hypothetical protein
LIFSFSVEDESGASLRSLAGSAATSRPATPSTSIGMSAPPESPQSYASRGRKVSRQVSGIDKTSQCSSMNYSIHHEESIEKILLEKGDDSFHLPTHTLISPIAQSIPTPTANHKKSISGRFTVSPAQNIPSVSFKPKNETGTPPKSESSASQSLIETEMQFKMSDTSLSHIDEKAQNADQKKPLLQDSIELGRKFLLDLFNLLLIPENIKIYNIYLSFQKSATVLMEELFACVACG